MSPNVHLSIIVLLGLDRFYSLCVSANVPAARSATLAAVVGFTFMRLALAGFQVLSWSLDVDGQFTRSDCLDVHG